jgi:putative membrane protein
VANIVALYAAAIYIEGFTVNGDWRTYVVLGIVFTLLNAIVRPIAKTFAGPLIVLTIGLFTIVVNAAMFLLLDFGSDALTIQGYVPLLLATLLAGVVNFIFYLGRRALGLGK